MTHPDVAEIMRLLRRVLAETGWECGTESPPALKQAADDFESRISKLVEERDALKIEGEHYDCNVAILTKQRDSAEAEAAALRKDAERFRALVWADQELLEGPRTRIESHWEYKPAKYDGLDVNRFYMGPTPRSFEQCADFAVERMNAALAAKEEKPDPPFRQRFDREGNPIP